MRQCCNSISSGGNDAEKGWPGTGERVGGLPELNFVAGIAL